MSDPGVIRSRAYLQQIKNFSGMRFGNISPTDIDGFMDFGDRLFIFIESKCGGAPVPRGQMLALERLCDATNNLPRRYSFAILCDHTTPNGEDVDFATQSVRIYRRNGQWHKPMAPTSVREAVDRLRSYVDNMTRLRAVKETV